MTREFYKECVVERLKNALHKLAEEKQFHTDLQACGVSVCGARLDILDAAQADLDEVLARLESDVTDDDERAEIILRAGGL